MYCLTPPNIPSTKLTEPQQTNLNSSAINSTLQNPKLKSTTTINSTLQDPKTVAEIAVKIIEPDLPSTLAEENSYNLENTISSNIDPHVSLAKDDGHTLTESSSCTSLNELSSSTSLSESGCSTSSTSDLPQCNSTRKHTLSVSTESLTSIRTSCIAHRRSPFEPPQKRYKCDCSTKRRRTVSFQEEYQVIEDRKLVHGQNGESSVMGSKLCITSKGEVDNIPSSDAPNRKNDTADSGSPVKMPQINLELVHKNGAMPGSTKLDTGGDHTPDSQATPTSAAATPTSTYETKIMLRNLSNSDANCDPNEKYTFEQITQHLQTRFTKLLQSDNYDDDTNTPDLRFIKRRTNYNPSNTFRLRIADKMDELGIIQLFMRVWSCIHENMDKMHENASLSLNNLVQVVSTIWNISDISRSLCEKIARSGILEQVLQDLNDDHFSLKKLDDDTRLYYVKGVFGILHNICRHCRDSRENLRSLGAVNALQRYLDAETEIIHCRVLLILCYLINEHENDVIHADHSHINYIVDILKSAVESKGHFSRKFGFSASEIACGLNHLAANDCNKQRIVDSGALPLYVELLKPMCTTDEQKIAARGLWTLAFNEVCKGHISVEPKAINSLQWLVANSTDERVRHGARGALWEVSARWRVNSLSHEQDKLVSDTQHIMISYQWDSKPTMMKVKDGLQAQGYKVWMDVQNMSGSTLEAMALAVERAAAVIVCLSQKYKDSPNCRSEAEYSYRLRKRVVPLVLENNYTPDGWLGIMIGTRLYFDFSLDSLFDASLEGLVKELGDAGKLAATGTITSRTSGGSDTLMPLPSREVSPMDRVDTAPDFVLRQSSQVSNLSTVSSVLSCGSSIVQIPFCDVNSWLMDHELTHLNEKLRSFSIELLKEMKEVQKECPKFLYKTLQTEYGLKLVDILKISRALRRTSFP